MSSSQNEYSFFLRKPKILFAPLDWGLGHATRSIPLIQHLLDRGCSVYLAGDGPVASVLQEAFPDLPLLPLPGYQVRYAKEGKYFGWTMLQQLPRLIRVMRTEKRWLREQMERHAFDAVISDNRPGLHHTQIPCVYITHQLTVLAGSRWNTFWATRWHRQIIRKFDACWVPDEPQAPGLAGLLSHPVDLPKDIQPQYLGVTSRLEPTDSVQRESNHLLVLLSGPEPQRSLLEQKVLEQLKEWKGTALIVRGLPATDQRNPPLELPDRERMRVEVHLPPRELALEMQRAGWVWCRSGYTSVMDLVRLHTPAVLVPTPGQSEQLYLAKHLSEAGYFPFQLQEELNIHHAIKQLSSPPLHPPISPPSHSIITSWLLQHFSPDSSKN